MTPPGWYPDPSGLSVMRYFDGAQWTAVHHAPPPVITVNSTVATPTVVVMRGPNHALHAVLTLLTCGLWLWVWLAVALVNKPRMELVPPAVAAVPVAAQRRPFVDEHPVLAVFAALACGVVVFGAAIGHWPVLLGLAAVAGLAFLARSADRRAARRRAELAMIAARADREHQALLAGDPAGTFGQYPPAAI